MSRLIPVITGSGEVRDQSLDAICRTMALPNLPEECAALDRFRSGVWRHSEQSIETFPVRMLAVSVATLSIAQRFYREVAIGTTLDGSRNPSEPNVARTVSAT